MNIASLRDLLSQEEINKLEGTPHQHNFSSSVKFLNVETLSNISLVLIQTEHQGKVPACCLAAEAINILTDRAIKKNLAIF